jgi:uncharacterized protein involved in exopolysaccharide biosynthesis/Mrp family chromosome partitioning ATPase
MLVRQAVQNGDGRTAPSAPAPPSWENPVRPMAANADADAHSITSSLTVAGVTTFARRNGKKIISLALILFTAGFFILSIIPVKYAATALVVVDPREQRVTAEQDVLPGIGQDAAALQSLIEIAKSDGFLTPLIDTLKIADDDEIAAGEKEPSRLLDKFRSRLDITRRGLTYVIAISFVSRSPERAAHYANAVAEAFVSSQTQVHSVATDEAAAFLNSRLKTLSDRLRASEDAVAAFKAEHRIVNAGRESTTRQLRVTELSQQVSAARLRSEEARNRFEQAERDLKANVDAPSSSRTDLLNILRALRSQLNDQIAQKRAVLGDRHPDLVISLNQLSELNRQIEIERKRTIDSAKSDYETMLDQQKSLESQLKSLEGELLADGQASVRLQELERDAEANKNIYEQFLSRFKTTNEQRLQQSSQVKVVSAATAPTRPTRPPLSLILVALAIGALLSSVAIVTLIEAVGGAANSDSVDTITDPNASDLRSSDFKSSDLEPADPKPEAVETPLQMPAWNDNPGLAASGAEKSVWRATMLHEGEGAAELGAHLKELLDGIVAMPGRRGKVVLVTSGETCVGKSSVARSLNSLAVERGMLSVLIEVLPDQLLSRARLGPADQNSADGVRALRTNARSVNVLLDNSKCVDVGGFSGDVRTEFNLIVIDAPALTEQSEVAAMLAHADFTILVARDGATNPGAINKAKAALSTFGNSLIGIVINKADDKVASRLATAR